jgi:hypothetical protein
MHLSIMLGAGEKRTEPYCNTVKEYRNQQRRRMPKAYAKRVALLLELHGRCIS